MAIMVDFVTCLNCFFSGAIMMLIALCIQPEVVGLLRKVYHYDFKEHRKQHEKDEAFALLQKKLDKLYDLTRDHCTDELDEQVGNAWTDVDNSIALLLGEEQADPLPDLLKSKSC
jgi:hypothetical protein